MLVSGDLRVFLEGRGSFSPSPKSVAQQPQPADLYFSVFHAAGLVQATRQASVGKRGWERASHLICTCLLGSALLWVTCAHTWVMLQFRSCVLAALSHFLHFLLSVVHLGGVKGLKTRGTHPRIERERGKSKEAMILDCN